MAFCLLFLRFLFAFSNKRVNTKRFEHLKKRFSQQILILLFFRVILYILNSRCIKTAWIHFNEER